MVIIYASRGDPSERIIASLWMSEGNNRRLVKF